MKKIICIFISIILITSTAIISSAIDVCPDDGYRCMQIGQIIRKYPNDAQTHHVVLYELRKCIYCSTTYENILNSSISSHSKSLKDNGHAGSVHYYSDYCIDCSYNISSYSIPCKGAPHAAPYSIPINLND